MSSDETKQNWKPTMTLAKLFEQQNQLYDALAIYEIINESDSSPELKLKIEELQARILSDPNMIFDSRIEKMFSPEELTYLKIMNHSAFTNLERMKKQFAEGTSDYEVTLNPDDDTVAVQPEIVEVRNLLDDENLPSAQPAEIQEEKTMGEADIQEEHIEETELEEPIENKIEAESSFEPTEEEITVSEPEAAEQPVIAPEETLTDENEPDFWQQIEQARENIEQTADQEELHSEQEQDYATLTTDDLNAMPDTQEEYIAPEVTEETFNPEEAEFPYQETANEETEDQAEPAEEEQPAYLPNADSTHDPEHSEEYITPDHQTDTPDIEETQPESNIESDQFEPDNLEVNTEDNAIEESAIPESESEAEASTPEPEEEFIIPDEKTTEEAIRENFASYLTPDDPTIEDLEAELIKRFGRESKLSDISVQQFMELLREYKLLAKFNQKREE